MRRRKYIKSIAAALTWLTLAGLIAPLSAQQNSASVQVNRTDIAENETVSLTVSVAGQVDTQAVDFSALRQDFEILSLSPSSQTQIINGHMTSETRWQLVLSPKRRGTLRIPQFVVAGAKTQPIEINVRQPTTIGSGELDFEAVLETDRDQALAGEQVIVTITLTASESVRDLNGEQLEVDNADVVFIDQKEFRRTINGTSYNVVELRYALFPESEGQVNIPAQTFSGRLFTNRNRFDPFRRGQRILSRTTPLSITVSGAAQTSQPWFPASAVTVRSKWAADKGDMVVGQPITRHVEIVAEGQRASAIPPLPVTQVDGVKRYEDQPQLANAQADVGVIGTRTQSAAIVATRAGRLTLPEVVVHWYDINAKTMKTARLPAEQLIVSAAGGDQSVLPNDAPQLGGEATDRAQEAARQTGAPSWLAILLTLAVIGLSGVSAALYLQNRRLQALLERQTSSDIQRQRADSEVTAWRSVATSLEAGDIAQVRSAILAWARARWPQAGALTLQHVARAYGEQSSNPGLLASQLRSIDQYLFANGPRDAVDTEALMKLLNDLRKAKTKKQPVSLLPELYPGQALTAER